MQILNIRICLALAAAVVLAACGKQERLEAVQFAKVLAAKQGNLNAADTIENEFITNARAWCSGIAGSGSGHGEQLDQNATVAAELAKSAVAVSGELSAIRQAIDSQPLKEEYPRNVRNALSTQLTRRQRALQEVRALLDSSAAQFREYRQSRSFKGDTYPDAIAKLDAILSSYKPPEAVVGTALSELKTKYSLRDNEI
jgi:hypothetical protein